MKEFRIIIKNKKNLRFDTSSARDFTDYYLSRSRRIRYFPKENKYKIIISEPGMIIKNYSDINEQEAKNLIKQAVLIIEKKGIGHIMIGDIQGYAEHVLAYKPDKNEKKVIVDEDQIEFEVDFEMIPIIKETLKVSGIIEKGLFDYVSDKILMKCI